MGHQVHLVIPDLIVLASPGLVRHQAYQRRRFLTVGTPRTLLDELLSGNYCPEPKDRMADSLARELQGWGIRD